MPRQRRSDLVGRGAVPDACERAHYVAFVATHDDGHFQRARSRRTAGGADTSNASNIRARRTASRGYRHRHWQIDVAARFQSADEREPDRSISKRRIEMPLDRRASARRLFADLAGNERRVGESAFRRFGVSAFRRFGVSAFRLSACPLSALCASTFITSPEVHARRAQYATLSSRASA
ncbi:hypothetical protein WI41_19150 [Burkholderia latens]|uniref:Uncharacterized protein n=1 Tax=Burkholderia latens TaxID=488446 RepID=A0AAP1C3B3_9BURK|nr:hypothetical protein WI41_19150 [Burkholderia latens]